MFYRIIHHRATRQLNIGYKLFPTEWDGLHGTVLLPAERSRHAYLGALKNRIAEDKARLERIVARLERAGESYTAGDVSTLYLTPSDTRGFLASPGRSSGNCGSSARPGRPNAIRPS